VRAPVDHIPAPAFPREAEWVNVASLRMDQQRGRPVLLEFWDFCRPNSIRTLPYVKAWNERYLDAGLRVIGVHASGFPPSADPDAVRAAVERLGISYPVMIDAGHVLWQEYENLGWPARYLWDANGHLFDFHYGEGAYLETELAIQELLGVEREPLPALRREDEPGAALVAPSDTVEGVYCGPYEAGGVWAVLSGHGSVVVNGVEEVVDHAGAYELIAHPHNVSGTLSLDVGDGVVCHAVCFTPGLSWPGSGS
jgi:hypothetical protein